MWGSSDSIFRMDFILGNLGRFLKIRLRKYAMGRLERSKFEICAMPLLRFILLIFIAYFDMTCYNLYF